MINGERIKRKKLALIDDWGEHCEVEAGVGAEFVAGNEMDIVQKGLNLPRNQI